MEPFEYALNHAVIYWRKITADKVSLVPSEPNEPHSHVEVRRGCAVWTWIQLLMTRRIEFYSGCRLGKLELERVAAIDTIYAVDASSMAKVRLTAVNFCTFESCRN